MHAPVHARTRTSADDTFTPCPRATVPTVTTPTAGLRSEAPATVGIHLRLPVSAGEHGAGPVPRGYRQVRCRPYVIPVTNFLHPYPAQVCTDALGGAPSPSHLSLPPSLPLALAPPRPSREEL